jgi:hypothetical protein
MPDRRRRNFHQEMMEYRKTDKPILLDVLVRHLPPIGTPLDDDYRRRWLAAMEALFRYEYTAPRATVEPQPLGQRPTGPSVLPYFD